MTTEKLLAGIVKKQTTKIRLATDEDAAEIHSLVIRMAESMGVPENVASSPDDFLQYGFASASLFEALIAEVDESPQTGAVGLCIYFLTFSSWRGEPGIYVQDLYVDERMRGSGLGRKLLSEASRHGAAKGATHLRLCVDHENAVAQQFYSAIGMKWRHDEQVYEAAGDAFISLRDTKS